MRPMPGLKTRPTCVTQDRKSTRLNSSHVESSYAVFCLTKESEAVQGHGAGQRPVLEGFAVRSVDRHLRGRQGRLQSGRCGRIHPVERAAHANRGQAGSEIRRLLSFLLFIGTSVSAAPFAIQLGDTRLGLDAPPGFTDSGFTGSPRLQELAESLTSA